MTKKFESRRNEMIHLTAGEVCDIMQDDFKHCETDHNKHCETVTLRLLRLQELRAINMQNERKEI